MRIVRIEHSSVLRNNVPAGPYGDDAFVRAEHDDNNVSNLWDEECDNCIHTFSDNLAWKADEKRPMPIHDGLYGLMSDHLFGFKSYDTMHAWFLGDLRKLDRFGFVAAVYEVPKTHAQHGKRQSVFLWKTAMRVGDTSILSRKNIENLMST